MKDNNISGLEQNSGIFAISDSKARIPDLQIEEIRCAEAFSDSLDPLDPEECRLASLVLVDECGQLGLDEAIFTIDHAIQQVLPHWSTGRCLWLMERFLYWIRFRDQISQARLRALASLIDTAREQRNYPNYKCMPKVA